MTNPTLADTRFTIDRLSEIAQKVNIAKYQLDDLTWKAQSLALSGTETQYVVDAIRRLDAAVDSLLLVPGVTLQPAN